MIVRLAIEVLMESSGCFRGRADGKPGYEKFQVSEGRSSWQGLRDQAISPRCKFRFKGSSCIPQMVVLRWLLVRGDFKDEI